MRRLDRAEAVPGRRSRQGAGRSVGGYLEGSGRDGLGDAGRQAGNVPGRLSSMTTGQKAVMVGYGRRGRPTENPRDHIFQLRLNHDEVELLDLISYATEDSKSDVIRKALKMYASVKKSDY